MCYFGEEFLRYFLQTDLFMAKPEVDYFRAFFIYLELDTQ